MSAAPTAPAAGGDAPVEEPLDLAAMFPADPSLMISLEGDKRGLRRLQAAAEARRRALGYQPS